MKTRTIVAALLIAGTCQLGAQTVQWRVPITFQYGTKKDTLYVGINSGNGGAVKASTYGLDLTTTNNFGPLGLYGESGSPPPNADGDRIRFIDVPGHTQLTAAGGLFKFDYRGYTSAAQIDTFVVEITGLVVEGNDVIVSWPANLTTYAAGWSINSRTPAAIGASLKDMLQSPFQHTFSATGNPLRFAIVKSGANAVTGVRSLEVNAPRGYSLDQNFPNPFNPSTEIRFSIAQAGPVRLTVFNLLGQEVAQLVNDYRNAGSYAATFDASALASGTYIYKLTAGGFTAVHKLMLLK
jgi:hypothetical protein